MLLLLLCRSSWLVLMKQPQTHWKLHTTLIVNSFFLAKSHSHRDSVANECNSIENWLISRCTVSDYTYIQSTPTPLLWDMQLCSQDMLRFTQVYYCLPCRLTHISFPETHPGLCHFLAACSFLLSLFSYFFPFHSPEPV